MKITKDIPIIDPRAIPEDLKTLISDEIFDDRILNAYQLFYLYDDEEEGSAGEKVTQWLRNNGITGDRVLFDNTW